MAFTPKTTTINFRINAALKGRIDALAEKHYLSLSSMAHVLLAWGADAFENHYGGLALEMVERARNPEITPEQMRAAKHKNSLTEIPNEIVPVRSAGSVARKMKTGNGRSGGRRVKK